VSVAVVVSCGQIAQHDSLNAGPYLRRDEAGEEREVRSVTWWENLVILPFSHTGEEVFLGSFSEEGGEKEARGCLHVEFVEHEGRGVFGLRKCRLG
jgi:hypothetical protein